MKLPSINNIFDLFIKAVLVALTLVIVAVLVVGLFAMIWEIKGFFLVRSFGQSLHDIVVQILTFLVIIELFRNFIVYFEAHRFRLSTMIDPAIIFVIRELIVKLYGEHAMMPWQMVAALGFLLLCLGIIRTLAVRYSPSEEAQESRPPTKFS